MNRDEKGDLPAHIPKKKENRDLSAKEKNTGRKTEALAPAGKGPLC